MRPTRRKLKRDVVLEAMQTDPGKSWTNADLCLVTGLGPGQVMVGLAMLERGGFVASEIRDVTHEFYHRRRFYWLTN